MTSTTYRFGDFELDVENAELRRLGQPVKLRPQPFRALTLFVTRAGQLVTREELRLALWGDSSFVDFNAGVNFCIAQLRAALDDPAARSAYLVAIPRRGYKFVAAVETVTAAPLVSAAAGDTVPAAHRERPSSQWAALAASVAVGIGIWVAFGIGDASVPYLEARQYYELGAIALADAGPTELQARVGYFNRAIELHPQLADAYVGLADAKLIVGQYRVESPSAAYAAAKASAELALGMSPQSADAHALYGGALMYYDWDWKAADAHLQRALALDASSSRAHTWSARYFSARGAHDRAISHARKALALQPGSVSAKTNLGAAYFLAGRFTEARDTCRNAADLMAHFTPAWSCAMNAAAEAGDLAQFMPLWGGLARAGGSSVAAYEAARAATGYTWTTYWRERLARAESSMQGHDPNRNGVGVAIAAVHAGEIDRALTLLELAAERRIDQLVYAAVHPAFAPLRTHPRFARVLERVGFGG